ncbi:hypothetical protein LTR66_016809 [Elasticomyces elasticus]|nr:hypothetical protein LTR66_016809 [Elasticomyces elasticus]
MADVAGLVSSIITFVDLTAKIVSRVHEYLVQATDTPKVLINIDTILPLLAKSLETVRTQALTAHLNDEVVDQLHRVVNGALTQIEKLEKCIQILTPARQSSTFQKVDKAVKGVFKYDARVDQALEKLRQYLDTISFYHSIASVATAKEIVKALHVIDNDNRDRRYQEENELVKAWVNGAPRDDYIDICLANRSPGTCEWLQQSSTFQKWSSPEFTDDAPKFLWIHGPPGIGKTFISASIFTELEKSASDTTVAFFWSSEKHNA